MPLHAEKMKTTEENYTPLQRKLQTLAIASVLTIEIFGGILGALFLIYLTFFTSYWIISLAYLIWAYIIDKDTCERGSRRTKWVCDLTWFRYQENYFPLKLKRVPSGELDPKRNYLFCCFPHGLLALGPMFAFGANFSTFQELFPNHAPHAITVSWNFRAPFVREIALAIGLCSASVKSLNWLLSYPNGGKVVCLVIGGAAEALKSRPGKYSIFLKKRKGFVKLALKNGTPLVPVITFGEPDLYDQFSNPKGSLMRKFQEWVKNIVGFSPIIPLGRGFFQESFGLIPRRRPLTTVVGKPLDVVKTEHPTQAQIDALHAEFMEKLTEMFEEQKFNYLPNPDQVSLIIE